MKNKYLILGAVGGAVLSAFGNQQPTGNENPAYGASHIQAQLRLNIRDGADEVHFIRDTNDPHILTKTYVLEHADPYSIRPFLRSMVQAQRVDYNNAAGRGNTAFNNTYTKTIDGETEFVPCGIECVKYSDGTGLLIVSAEDYRFEDSAYGMGIDELVKALDKPGIMNSSGQPKFIYFPKNRSAAELRSMIRNVGANISNDTAELIGGKDKVETDTELNCLFFNTALYSRKNIEEMLALYDVPHPEVRVRCLVYELNSENDDMIGIDFQSWKNNDGVHLFESGARWSHNANMDGAIGPVADRGGTVNNHYFNVNPRWDTRFLDFLVSKGKAEVVASASLTIESGATGSLERSSGILYADASEQIASTGQDEPEHGKAVTPKVSNAAFTFALNLTPDIAEKATTLKVTAKTKNMAGYTSDGAARGNTWESTQEVLLGNGRTRFYLGGIDKSLVVKDNGGVPLLKDIPGLKWLFATERTSVKKSRLIVVAECETIRPDTALDADTLKQIEVIRK